MVSASNIHFDMGTVSLFNWPNFETFQEPGTTLANYKVSMEKLGRIMIGTRISILLPLFALLRGPFFYVPDDRKPKVNLTRINNPSTQEQPIPGIVGEEAKLGTVCGARK